MESKLVKATNETTKRLNEAALEAAKTINRWSEAYQTKQSKSDTPPH